MCVTRSVSAARRAVGAVARAALVALSVVALGGCARRPPAGGAPESAPARRPAQGATFDIARLYQQAGLIAEDAPVSFVGDVEYLAGPSPDGTLVLLTLSLPNRALSFAREGDEYTAAYAVAVELRQQADTVRRVAADEVVRVASYKETTRGDESIIFQQFLTAPPGQYVLALTVRDKGSARSGTYEGLLAVPRLGEGTLSTPISVYEAAPRVSRDSLPRLITSPRSTVNYGRDSVLPVYVEAYGDGASVPLLATVRDGRGRTLWRDSLTLRRTGALFAGTITVPVPRLGIGLSTLVVRRADRPDTVRTPIFVGFGDNIAVASFDELLSYLRYFAPPERLAALRDTAAELRPQAWAAFLRETDPLPSTPEHEALRDYFNRIEQANQRFREEGGSGWLTDRGMVYVALGEPDQVLEDATTELGRRGRRQLWQYHQYRASLMFIDQTGFGRWKLTTSSEADFQSILRRLRTR